MTATTPVLQQPGAAPQAIDFETTKEVGYYTLVWRRFRSRKVALFATILLAVLILACVAGPVILPAECPDLSPGQNLLGPFSTGQSISTQCGVGSHFHLLGTDDNGRDLLLRNLNGGRISLLVGFTTMLITIMVATALGSAAGFFGGVIDSAVTALTNGVLSIPSILLLIILVKTANPRGDAQLAPSAGLLLTLVLGVLAIGLVLAMLAQLGRVWDVLVGDVEGVAAGEGGKMKLFRSTALVVGAALVAVALFLLVLLNSSAGVLGNPLIRFNQQLTAVLIIVLAISAITWPPTSRIVRSVILSVREKEFVEAARAVGTPRVRLITRHLLPNALGPIVVSASLTIGIAILTESAISFLGYGINPPTATWGNILDQGRSLSLSSTAGFFFDVWPGLLILLTVLSFNYIGDALRDAFDPRSLER